MTSNITFSAENWTEETITIKSNARVAHYRGHRFAYRHLGKNKQGAVMITKDGQDFVKAYHINGEYVASEYDIVREHKNPLVLGLLMAASLV
jgi:hypothetical protein